MLFKKSTYFVWFLTFTLLFPMVSTIDIAQAAPTWQSKANKVSKLADQNTTRKNKKKQYQSGKVGPDKFDCSGFTQFIYKKSIKYSLPRRSSDQANKGKTIAKSKIRKGDLLFFKTNGKNISHVGIYIGNGKMIHAANERKDIQTTDINISYWKNNFVRAKRVIQ